MMMLDGVKGEGPVVEKTVSVGEFEKIATEGSFETVVTVGPERSVTIYAQENIHEILTAEVKNSTLVIGSEEGYSTREGVKLVITTPRLKGASISGSGELTADGIDAESFEGRIAGSGDMTLKGQAKKLDLSIAGSGEIDADDVESKAVSATINGSGEIDCHADDSLDASISGSGDIRYKGDPEVSESINGSGDVSRA